MKQFKSEGTLRDLMRTIWRQREVQFKGTFHWDDPEGWNGEGGGRREEGSGWGTHVYLWRIHFDIWQN